MKKKFLLFTLFIACLLVGLIDSCRKDPSISPPTDIGTKISFTEEFENVYDLTTKGWVIKDNSGSNNYAGWIQGYQGFDKSGVWHGFSAYSYTTSLDEFIYSSISASSNSSISSWLITPVLSVKNGDKISFYTRADTAGLITERLQVLMNKSSSSDVGNDRNSVGNFKTILFDINSAQNLGAYPKTWTKYEYIFSGISGNIDTRIGFRHYLSNTTNARGIGIDLFKFEVN